MSNQSWKWWRRGGEGLDGRHLIPHGHFALVITHRGAGGAGPARWHGTASVGSTPWSPRGTATTRAGLPGAGPLALRAVLDASSRHGAGAVPLPGPSSDQESPQEGESNRGSSVLSPLLTPSSNLSRCFVVGVARLVRRHFGAQRTQTSGKELCWQRFLSSVLPVLLFMWCSKAAAVRGPSLPSCPGAHTALGVPGRERTALAPPWPQSRCAGVG